MIEESDIRQLIVKSVGWLSGRFLTGGEPVPAGLIERLEVDSRRSARALAAKLQARRVAGQIEGERLRHLWRYEERLRAEGFLAIAGVDEAGVGPLAGPVIAGAVILPAGYLLPDLDDSKRLSAAKREALARRIRDDAVAWAVGLVDVAEIDSLNIYHASLEAMRRAVEALAVKPDYLLVDARTVPACRTPQEGIVRGDALSASIAAASIIAKTTRDALMVELDRCYPGYGLAIHKGYPTAAHLQAIREHGVLPIHRRSFTPVREALRPEPSASASQ